MDVAAKTFTWAGVANKVVTHFKRATPAEMNAIPPALLDRGDTCLVFDRGDGTERMFSWSGTVWVPAAESTVPIATTESLGVVQVGAGLDITTEGILSVIGDFVPGGETWIPIPGAPSYGTSGAAAGNGCFYFCTDSSWFNQYTCDNGGTRYTAPASTPPGRGGAFCNGWFTYVVTGGDLKYWSVAWGDGGTQVGGPLPDGSSVRTVASDGQVLYAAGGDWSAAGSAIYRCDNFPSTEGLVWTKVADFPGAWPAGATAEFMAVGHGFLWASTGQDDLLYRLRLGTGTWELGTSVGLRNSSPIAGMAFGDGILIVVPQTGSILRRSSDDGATWRDSVVPSADSVGYSGGIAFGNHGFILSPRSGGTTAYSSFGSLFTLHPATRSTLGGVRIGDGIDVASDGLISIPPDPEKNPGFIWTASGRFPPGSWAAGASSGNTALIVSSASDPSGLRALRTLNAGATWEPVALDPGMSGPVTATCVGGVVYIACGADIWYRSIDDTTPLWASIPGTLPDGAAAKVLVGVGAVLCAVSYYGSTLYTWNAGAVAWEIYDTPPVGGPWDFGVTGPDFMALWCGDKAYFYSYSTRTWTAKTTPSGMVAGAYLDETHMVILPAYPAPANPGFVTMDMGGVWRSATWPPPGGEIGVACVLTLDGGFIAVPNWSTAPLTITAFTSYLRAMELVPATASTLGGVIIGANVGVTADGTISVAAPPVAATTTTLGLVMPGNNLTVDGAGRLSAPTPPSAATATTLGLVMPGNNLTVDGAGKLSAPTPPGAATTTVQGIGRMATTTEARNGTTSGTQPAFMTPENVAAAVAPKTVPVGTVIMHAASTAPTGFLVCDGSSLSTTTFAALFAVIGYTFGGSGTNFLLPDLRGEFLRGWANGAGVDASRAFGSSQGDAIRNILAFLDGIASAYNTSTSTGALQWNASGAVALTLTTKAALANIVFDASRAVPTATENRPHNVALLACIKY